MTIKLVALVLLCLMSGTAVAQEPKVTSLMNKDLPESPTKEALMITVEHAPGGASAIHRHNAHAFVYVLEGSVVMQLKGGQQVTLTPGQSFYEGPDDVHFVDRNASSTQPAKFLVLLIKDKGARHSCPHSDCYGNPSSLKVRQLAGDTHELGQHLTAFGQVLRRQSEREVHPR